MLPAARATAQVARRERVFSTTSVAVGSSGGERRAFGDAMAADFAEHHVRRIGEARRLGFQLGGGEEARRHAQRVGQSVHRRLVGLEIKRDDAGNRRLGQALRGEGVAGQSDQFVRWAPALAADAQRQDGRMQDQGGRASPRRRCGR